MFLSHGRFSFEGEYINNVENGYGVEICENHNVYIGEYKNGMKHGLGLNHFPDGGKYEGEFNNGCISGWVRIKFNL